jgi:hypothetical protein
MIEPEGFRFSVYLRSGVVGGVLGDQIFGEVIKGELSSMRGRQDAILSTLNARPLLNGGVGLRSSQTNCDAGINANCLRQEDGALDCRSVKRT